jgi:hypothetical protein
MEETHMENPFIRIGRFYVSIQTMQAEPYRTYFRNSEGRCWIFRGFGILFVAVLKAKQNASPEAIAV